MRQALWKYKAAGLGVEIYVAPGPRRPWVQHIVNSTKENRVLCGQVRVQDLGMRIRNAMWVTCSNCAKAWNAAQQRREDEQEE